MRRYGCCTASVNYGINTQSVSGETESGKSPYPKRGVTAAVSPPCLGASLPLDTVTMGRRNDARIRFPIGLRFLLLRFSGCGTSLVLLSLYAWLADGSYLEHLS